MQWPLFILPVSKTEPFDCEIYNGGWMMGAQYLCLVSWTWVVLPTFCNKRGFWSVTKHAGEFLKLWSCWILNSDWWLEWERQNCLTKVSVFLKRVCGLQGPDSIRTVCGKAAPGGLQINSNYSDSLYSRIKVSDSERILHCVWLCDRINACVSIMGPFIYFFLFQWRVLSLKLRNS